MPAASEGAGADGPAASRRGHDEPAGPGHPGHARGAAARLRDAVDDFAGHLSQVRNRSAHTVRAYVADLVSLLDHAVRMGCHRTWPNWT